MKNLEIKNTKEVCKRVFKFLTLGGVVAVSMMLIQQNTKMEEVLMMALVAAATFAILDMYAPTISTHAQQGAGLGIGLGLVGGVPVAR